MARGKDGGAPKKGKKNRKLGNNQKYCTFYKATGRQEANRQRRILRHLKKQPNDLKALEALK
jgi:hypothetical protein